MKRVWLGVGVVLAGLVLAAWASDFLTMQDERTIFTVRCIGGEWAGERCTGKLAAAPRYRFRALKPHGEVVFWIVGGSEPSGKLSNCVIQDGRNWRCEPSADASRSITLEMAQGTPVAGMPGTLGFHRIPKWRWYLLRQGF
ncbi:hypothetical protein [Piscinibacter koreensis]|uniref:Uncharacterized protein n=1 Tax=Piscinibacter koreensis TaxID=2742824 RepID=A0A7Y6NL67_9BURK|nr:hypothetical protein [Schlegelella koreensis]NUZ05122.1 hypothetical protein [Schlegelella koreensis]